MSAARAALQPGDNDSPEQPQCLLPADPTTPVDYSKRAKCAVLLRRFLSGPWATMQVPLRGLPAFGLRHGSGRRGRLGSNGLGEAGAHAPHRPLLLDRPQRRDAWAVHKALCTAAGRAEPEKVYFDDKLGGDKYPSGNAWDPGKANFLDASCPGDTIMMGDETLDEHMAHFGGRDTVNSDGFPYTSPVASSPAGASPYGVLDMAANVFQWCPLARRHGSARLGRPERAIGSTFVGQQDSRRRRWGWP